MGPSVEAGYETQATPDPASVPYSPHKRFQFSNCLTVTPRVQPPRVPSRQFRHTTPNSRQDGYVRLSFYCDSYPVHGLLWKESEGQL